MFFYKKSLIFAFAILITSFIYAGDTELNIDSIPEPEKASALLNLAKSNYTSNYNLADEYSLMAILIAKKLNQKKELGIANKYLGITDYFRRDFDGALQHYEKAKSILEDADESKELANVINNIAIIYSESGDYTTSIEYYEKSLKIREELNDGRGILGSLANIGNLYSYQNDFHKALEYYNKSLEISRVIFPDEHFTDLLGNIAKAHSKLGNINKAIQFYLQAIEAAKEDNNIRSVIINEVNLGNLYFDHASTDKAISYLMEALQQARENNMEYLEGVAQLNIGNAYYQSEQYKKAIDFYKYSLIISKKTKDTESEIKGLINVALCNQKIGLQDSAGMGFLLAREKSEEYKSPSFLAMTANYLGKFYLNTNNYNESIQWLQKALDVATENNLNLEIYKANYNFGNYWYDRSNYKKSQKFFETAFNIASDMGWAISKKNASLGLWKSYKKLGDYKKALDILLVYNSIKDSIFDNEKQQQIRLIEGQLQLNLKESQIESQNKIITQQDKILKQEYWNKIFIISFSVLSIILLIIIINRAKIQRQKEKAQLMQANLTVERDLLQLQMNPHFIFNALNSIQSFISENSTFEAELFLSKFARLMRYYLDTSSKKWIDFSDEINAIELNLEIEKLRLNNKFNFKIIIDKSVETEDIQIPPMLLQPFIENAVKHGLRPKKEKGYLEIGFKMRKESIFCYVEDNGIGREASRKAKKVSKSHKSKGIELTKKRLSNLFNKSKKMELILIKDLKDEIGFASGTRIELYIPFNFI